MLLFEDLWAWEGQWYHGVVTWQRGYIYGQLNDPICFLVMILLHLPIPLPSLLSYSKINCVGTPWLQGCSIWACVDGEFLKFGLQLLKDVFLEFGRKKMLWQKGHSVFKLYLRVLEKLLQYFPLGRVKLNITMSFLIAEETLHERLLSEHLASEDESCILQIGLGSYFVYDLPSSAQNRTISTVNIWGNQIIRKGA